MPQSSCMATCCGCCTLLCFPCIIIIVIGLFGLSIAEIVMGSIHLHDCPYEKMIPIYLIVHGVVGIVFSGSFGSSAKKDEQGERNKCKVVCGLVVSLFTLAWFIVGHVYVFGHSDYSPIPGTLNYCNENLYLFAFWSIIVRWIVFAAVIVIMVWMACGAACTACFASDA